MKDTSSNASLVYDKNRHISATKPTVVTYAFDVSTYLI